MGRIIIDTKDFTTTAEEFFYDKEKHILKFKCSYDGDEYVGKDVVCSIGNMADNIIITVSDFVS